MKKIFTLVAMATLAFSANAQTESAFINLNVVSEAAVDKNTAESVTGGTELCSTDNVTMKVAYDDTYARIALWGETDAVNTVSVGGVSYDMPMGLQGQTNPDPNKIDGGQTSGAVFQFDVKADGYLYVFGKFAGNKNYYVWEGDVVNKVANPVAYTMVAALASDGTAVGYTLPADAEGYYTVGAGYDNGSKYLAADQCTEIFMVEGVTAENVPASKAEEMTKWKGGGNALGVIAFPVYADGANYFVNACGSKITVNGYVFVKGATEIATVSFGKGETAGINDVAAVSGKKTVKKGLVNGRLVIEKNGKQFSVAGAQIK